MACSVSGMRYSTATPFKRVDKGYFLNVLEGITVAALVGVFTVVYRYTKRFLNNQQKQADDIATLKLSTKRLARMLRRHSQRIKELENAT